MHMKRKRAFSTLRDKAAAGHVWAIDRLRWQIRRRLDRGWKRDTIARRLGLTPADLTRYLGPDMTPRLVRERRACVPR